MKRSRSIGLLGLSAAVVALAWVGVRRASLRALDEPGRTETYFATKAKHYFVRRAAEQIRRPQPSDLSQSRVIGGMQFRARCASCHGLEGRTASEIGSAMYPRASDLGSAEVQRWSDAELFWIIQNGIRLTGMPGFGKSLSDDQIWPLVDYIRSLGASGQGQTRDAGPNTSNAARLQPSAVGENILGPGKFESFASRGVSH